MVEQHSSIERLEEATSSSSDKKKKNRRSNRRSKHNSSTTCTNSGNIYNAPNGVHGELSGCLANGKSLNDAAVATSSFPSHQYAVNLHVPNDQESARASDVAFSSLPTMRINDPLPGLRTVENLSQFPLNLEGAAFSKSCPDPILHRGANVIFPHVVLVSAHKNQCNAENQKKCFTPHWSEQAVNEAIEKGDVFRASFRVNAHNRLEAYCTVQGVPIDILISGGATQNRAIEGDTVAIRLDPLPLWTRLKGSAGHVNSSASTDDRKIVREGEEMTSEKCKGKGKIDQIDPDFECGHIKDVASHEEHQGSHLQDGSSTGALQLELETGNGSYKPGLEELKSSSADPANVDYGHATENKQVSSAIAKICSMVNSYPNKRPTGRVVSIIERSPRRDAVVGFLDVKQWFSCSGGFKKETKRNNGTILFADREYVQFTPNDAKFPNMLIPVRSLPQRIKMRLESGDPTVGMELVAARIDDWRDDSFLPHAQVIHILGRGGEIESQVAAILFEHAICSTEFSPASISCLPELPWEVPMDEVERRKDLRNLCTFTIDPSTATDLDDALSIERVSDDIFRVGVHIADVSYFVLPGTALDFEAQIRSTSVYLRLQKLSMLPSVLSENMGSLIPGVDRLAFSIVCDINLAGDVVDRWIGHTVIRSCCKLSYQHAQDIIDGLTAFENPSNDGCPELSSNFGWSQIAGSVKSLHEISKRLRENRFKDGALSLDSSKLVFSFNECGVPFESMFYEQKDSNSLVEEFMLLANRTAAEVISRAFPDSSLLRRHPEPNLRKLKEFEAFCQKHDLELDTSSSGQLHLSLSRIREKLIDDPIFFDILVSYASKPMQLASYFSTGDFKDRKSDWAHYSLAVPLYTHFTSPLRRYPDIVVHRTLSAAIEAENMYLHYHGTLPKANKETITGKCFSGIHFDEKAVVSKECKEALSAAALKHRVLPGEVLTEVAAYCNKRKIASKHAEDACDKLYLWALLKNKQSLIVEARVLSLGPKFMSIYIHKLAIERRIHYDEVQGLMPEWLETTSTLILSLRGSKHSHRRGSPGKWRALEDVALIVKPYDVKQEQDVLEGVNEVGTAQLVVKDPGPTDELGIPDEIEPSFFPLTVRILSTIPVALHAIGGDDGPLDIGAKLYMSSYLT